MVCVQQFLDPTDFSAGKPTAPLQTEGKAPVLRRLTDEAHWRQWSALLCTLNWYVDRVPFDDLLLHF